jgi:hypothetical protein
MFKLYFSVVETVTTCYNFYTIMLNNIFCFPLKHQWFFFSFFFFSFFPLACLACHKHVKDYFRMSHVKRGTNVKECHTFM